MVTKRDPKTKPQLLSWKYFFYSPQLVLLFLTVGCLWLGYEIGTHYLDTGWRLVDAYIQEIVLSIRTSWLTLVMKGLTYWGYFGTIGVWLVLLALAYRKRQRPRLILYLVWMVTAEVAGLLMKQWFLRPRPDILHLVTETGPSFPSQHAFNGTVAYLTVVYLVSVVTRSFWKTLGVYLIALCLIVGIGLSRIYLGVHYASDVCGGTLFGFGVFSAGLWGYRWWLRLSRS